MNIYGQSIRNRIGPLNRAHAVNVLVSIRFHSLYYVQTDWHNIADWLMFVRPHHLIADCSKADCTNKCDSTQNSSMILIMSNDAMNWWLTQIVRNHSQNQINPSGKWMCLIVFFQFLFHFLQSSLVIGSVIHALIAPHMHCITNVWLHALGQSTVKLQS